MPPLIRAFQSDQMEIRHTIHISIVDDSKAERCNVLCGIDWSSAEAVSLAAERIKDRFGDRVQLEYLDLSKPITNHYHLELSHGIKNKNLSLPLLVINGKPRISGQFDFRMLLDTIETEVKIIS